MATIRERESVWTLADLVEHFGPMPASRVRMDPLPGTATVDDVLRVHREEKRLCELVDGVLVEKAPGYEETMLAVILITLLQNFVGPRKLGIVAGEGGMLRLAPGLVRIPDISFISKSRLPNGKPPREPIPGLVPNLAVEVLSRSNTEREMTRKLADYFGVGIELVWYVDLPTRTIRVFDSAEKSVVLAGTQTLTGGSVVPGFSVTVAEVFSVLDEPT